MLRRHLRRIRYYSASPERTMWHRAMDIALFTTFFLGFAAATACDFLIERPNVVAAWSGQLERSDEDRIVATLIDPNQSARWRGRVPVGEFDLRILDRTFGWPLRTWTREEPPWVELRVFAERGIYEQELWSLDAAGVDPEITEAIVLALRETPERYDRRTDSMTSWAWPRWLINAGMWWVMLYLLCLLGLIPARIAWTLFQKSAAEREAKLRRRGLCPGCGYDLRGLEFHERCPECGKLMS